MESQTNGKSTCFVVMGFDKKTDFETGREDSTRLRMALLLALRHSDTRGNAFNRTNALTKEQNEGIIIKFMNEQGSNAMTLPPLGPKQYQVSFNGNHGMRILPSKDTGGGFFLCCIQKKHYES